MEENIPYNQRRIDHSLHILPITLKDGKIEMGLDVISQQLSKEIPDILYHYTTSIGLSGILSSGKIWTTEIHYLNDKSEIQLAFDFIRNEIESQKAGVNKTRTDEELDLMLESLRIAEEINVSIASFTENGDQLSQWRGYGEIGRGYSLGLYGQALSRTVQNHKSFRLFPCIYDEQTQINMVKELVDVTAVLDIKSDPSYSSSLLFRSPFGDAALSLAAVIKSGGFKEEREWRLISPTLSFSDAKFRFGNHTLIPFWEFGLDLSNTLESIIVGPTPEAELSERAISGMLANIFPGNPRLWTSIKHSSIPFRKI
jgi:hypothetical protein